jgi:nicotinamide-nucleotide amidase
MNAEIVAVGSELLTAQRVDTNSLYLTEKLNELGVEVVAKGIVGDDRTRLTETLEQARRRVPLVIVTGGLGPTEDDVTRDSAAAACRRVLVFHQAVLDAIEARFRALGRTMAPINRRQAYIIDGAEILGNERGTAPGQWYRDEAGVLILLPGPPAELKHVFERECLPRLRAFVPPLHICTKVWRVAGMPESDVDQLISPLYTRYANPVTTILAGPGDIQVHLRAQAGHAEDARRLVEELGSQIEAALGDRIYSDNGSTLEEVVGRLLAARGMALAAAESCTGGLLAQRLTSVPGSSKYFAGGWVTYTNRFKSDSLGIHPEMLEKYGAASAEVAREMAERARALAGAALGIGITGVAGPTPDSGPGAGGPRPQGLVFIALASEGVTDIKERHFLGERDRVRWQASQVALDLIRRKLLSQA